MSLTASLHCREGLVCEGHLHDDFCTIDIYAQDSQHNRLDIFFHRVEDIERLVRELQKLGNDFAASRPDPAVVPVGADPAFDASEAAPTDVLPPQEEWMADQMPANAPAELGGES